MNIAVWSGPRALSTALMYAFASRYDTEVIDEPYYAAYLAQSGAVHPMATDVIERYETDPSAIARLCSKSAPGGAPIFYQKHMAHHILPDFDLSWMDGVRNVFLVRHPAHVIASYDALRLRPTPEAIGAPQLEQLYLRASAGGGPPPLVIDSADVRRAPERALRVLCARLGVDFDAVMLTWPSGPKEIDGSWAPFWYRTVHKTTGFLAGDDVLPEVPALYSHFLHTALRTYDFLRSKAIEV